MNTLELRYYRYKLNLVKCPCGVYKHFSLGVDAKFFAERHIKEHVNNNDPILLEVFENDEPVQDARTAKPGRHAGGVVHQNLY